MSPTQGGMCRECGRPFGFVPDFIQRAREKEGSPLMRVILCRECFGKSTYDRTGRRPAQAMIAEVVVETTEQEA